MIFGRSFAAAIILLASSSSAASIDVVQTIQSDDKSSSYLRNSLNAGDTLTVKIEGWPTEVAPNGVASFFVDSPGAKEEHLIELNKDHFAPDSDGYKYCKNISGNDVKTCIQRKFHVISDSAQYSVLQVKKVATKEAVIAKAVINTAANWSFNVSGGFVASRLTSPKFFAKETSATVEGQIVATQTVARNKSAEDDMSLGMGAFVHTCNEAWRDTWYWALLRPRCISFGLGLSDQSGDLNFMPALSWRIGQEFYFSFGAQMAKIDALPRGLSEGDTITSANDLAALDSKYETKPFISFSYQFLGASTKTTFGNAMQPQSK